MTYPARLGLTHIGLLLAVCGSVFACSAAHEDVGVDSSEVVSCSASQQLQAFEEMLVQPIRPPRMIAGLDLAGGDSWPGLTIDAAEQKLCAAQEVAIGEGDDPWVEAGWGVNDNPVLLVDYRKSTRKIDSWVLLDGYRGALDFQSRPTSIDDPSKPNPFGQHTYSIGVGRPVLRDGQTWELNWRKACDPSRPEVLDCWEKQATELFDALMYTYAPELPSTQDSCTKAETCLAKAFSTGDGAFGVRSLGIYMYVPKVMEPQPAPSTPGYLYGFTVKTSPFSGADMLLKLDAEGAVATAKDLGTRRTTCTMTVGMRMGDFLRDCVEVLDGADQNAALRAKVLGSAWREVSASGSAASGTWLLDVDGVRPTFGSERFDETAPTASARVNGITLDMRSSGRVLNEYAADGTFTFAGTASVLREYARLTQEYLHANMSSDQPRFSLGAPECLMPDGGDPDAFRPARGCTGMEMFLTPADPSSTEDPNLKRVSVGATAGLQLGMRTVLRAGSPAAVFCADPGRFGTCSHGPLFSATRDKVVEVLGGGAAAAVPPEAADASLYVRLFTKALVKYLRAVPEAPAPIDLARPELEALAPSDDDLSFTPTPEGNSLIARYRDRLEYKVLLGESNVPYFTFR